MVPEAGCWEIAHKINVAFRYVFTFYIQSTIYFSSKKNRTMAHTHNFLNVLPHWINLILPRWLYSNDKKYVKCDFLRAHHYMSPRASHKNKKLEYDLGIRTTIDLWPTLLKVFFQNFPTPACYPPGRKWFPLYEKNDFDIQLCTTKLIFSYSKIVWRLGG